MKLKGEIFLLVSELGQGGEDGQSGGYRMHIKTTDIKPRKGGVNNEYNSKVYVTDIAGMHDFFVLRVKDMSAFQR